MNVADQKKVIVITGASRGIGRSIALRLANENSIMILGYHLNEKGAAETLEEVRKRGATAETYKCSVEIKEEVDAMYSYILSKYSRVDILVNNAGILEIDFMLLAKRRDFDHIFQVNYLGAVWNSMNVIEAMKRQNYGRIINISSTVSKKTVPGSVIYSSSKAELNNYSLSLALELRNTGVTVNTILSGFMNTDMKKKYDQFEKLFSLGEEMDMYRDPECIAEGVAFFASDAAEFITGQILAIDGGYSL